MRTPGRYPSHDHPPERPATRPEPHIEQSLVRIEALAKLMDGAFAVPGTNFRIGLDGIVGLLPGVGDLISSAISTYLIYEARQLGAPRWLIARMVANTALDTVFGAVPVVGDAFDMLFRGNLRNMALLRKHLEKQGHLRPGQTRSGQSFDGRPHDGKIIEGEAVRVNETRR